MTAVVVATRSAHKLREVREILGSLPGVRLLDLESAGVPEDAEAEAGIEAFDTFRENALAKVRYFAARCGRPVIADDSGLCVDALGGAPGVRSRRFSGRTDLSGEALDGANNDLLLRRLEGVPDGERGAHYVCAVAVGGPGAGEEAVFEGRCDGRILRAPRGSGGFGYDPLFYIPSEGATFGELDPVRKNEISHRARAVRALRERLPAWLAEAGRGR